MNVNGKKGKTKYAGAKGRGENRDSVDATRVRLIDGKQDAEEKRARAKDRGIDDQMREYTTKYAFAARTSPIDARRTFSSSTAKNCCEEGENTSVSRLLAFFLPRGQTGRAAHIVRTADVTRIVTLTERPFVRNDRHQSEPSGVRPVEQSNPRRWQAR